ncbi:MAG: DUF4169 family protein [Pararhodobacter sp.]|nr:DUF4169 family protein [Pararhodobacter sp.]
MARVVNLRTRRKQAVRDKDRQAAAENAARHGRARAEQAITQARADKALRDLDGHFRETEPD